MVRNFDYIHIDIISWYSETKLYTTENENLRVRKLIAQIAILNVIFYYLIISTWLLLDYFIATLLQLH